MTEGRLDVLFAPSRPSGRDLDGNEFHGEVEVTTACATSSTT
jgi:hypothetical protein